MMMSLFSMFDPSALFLLPLNWLLMMLILLFLPVSYWKFNSRINKMLYLIIYSLNKEFESLFIKTMMIKGTSMICISLFVMIMLINLSSNFPYTFCPSAHLVFSISLSIPIWMSIIWFCWMNLTKFMFSHLVPVGTPLLLMPVMVLIEVTSNLIRPMALAVRLTANLIAGHLLMALLGNTLNINSYYSILIMLIQTMFMLFELMVAMIQSYVFSVLMTLYSSEIS
uniref:ATP synthase subunit a n=1 Tax=Livia junci TaxID=1449964 RepID=A0A344A2I7_9HEMI|nr:ATP synthase F0 subunit 6 [Livia junci]AWU48978.1 ATP synthase F0 subunit 6 [Livia junci]